MSKQKQLQIIILTFGLIQLIILTLSNNRKLARQEEKEREEEEDIRKASHADSLDQTKIQLEQEKQVCTYILMHP